MDLFAHRLLSRNFSQKKLTSPTTSEAASSPVSPTTSSKNKVTFFRQVRVVLIPTCEEYHDAKIACNIWFQDDEYASYKAESLDEVRNFIQYHANNGNFITVPEALRMLYQPEDAQTSGSDSEPSSALSGTFSH
jgi:hypothetical protein